MAISWYPGHMHKAKKEMIKIIDQVDLLIEVLDARTPIASSNPLLAEISKDLPRIQILNKCDLAEEKKNQLWLKYFSGKSQHRCLLSSKERPISASQIVSAAKQLLKTAAAQAPGDESNQAATPRRISLMIAGIPNVGKSTLLNKITARRIAKTGNEPAVTKGQQRVKLQDNWYLIDTPGLLWPKIEDQDAAYRLACTGTIRNTAVEAEDVAWFAAEFLLQHYRSRLEARYSLASAKHAPIDTAEQFLEHIATSSGGIGKRGQIDWHKAAEVLLNDFRAGKLGRITMEQPQ